MKKYVLENEKTKTFRPLLFHQSEFFCSLMNVCKLSEYSMLQLKIMNAITMTQTELLLKCCVSLGQVFVFIRSILLPKIDTTRISTNFDFLNN